MFVTDVLIALHLGLLSHIPCLVSVIATIVWPPQERSNIQATGPNDPWHERLSSTAYNAGHVP